MNENIVPVKYHEAVFATYEKLTGLGYALHAVARLFEIKGSKKEREKLFLQMLSNKDRISLNTYNIAIRLFEENREWIIVSEKYDGTVTVNEFRGSKDEMIAVAETIWMRREHFKQWLWSKDDHCCLYTLCRPI